MTTRKTAALLLVTLLAGCATPGPLHVYALDPAQPAEVRDWATDASAAAATVPSFLEKQDQLTGFAYDPFTDHFFLRLAPGNRIRVVDRPARAIKREFIAAGAPETGGGDLAVKPKTGHLFLLHPTEPAVIETSRLGERVRTFALAGLDAPAAGIAYDAAQDELLVLARDRRQVSRHTLTGEKRGGITLDRTVSAALGFDSERREIYAPLATTPATLGVFDEHGKLLRTLDVPGAFIDLGPRSFIRVF